MIKLGCLLLLLFFCRMPALAQNIYGTSSINIDPSTNTGTADCETDTDAGADNGYYAVGVSCAVTDSNGNTLASDSDIDENDVDGYAAVTLTFSATPGITYTVTGMHTAKATVVSDSPEYPVSPTYYYDPDNFTHYIESPNQPTSNYYDWFGPGPEQKQRTQIIKLPPTTDKKHYPKATININFGTVTGSPKSLGDSLSFSADKRPRCSELLGLQNCSSLGWWYWQLEGSYTVSDDASLWTIAQSTTKLTRTGTDYDTNGNLKTFSVSYTVGPDGPQAAFTQSTSGTTTGYWIDGPGVNTTGPDGGLTVSEDVIQSFSVQICSTQMQGVCSSVAWHVHLIVSNAQLQATSSANYGAY